MDQSFIDQQKEKLLAEKERIVSQLREMTNAETFDKDRVQVKWQELGDKEEDSAVEVSQFQDSISLERSLEENLEGIEKALGKAAAGKYGTCDVCGSEIGEARLRAYPAAARCVKCNGA